jgi:hypothetical protein
MLTPVRSVIPFCLDKVWTPEKIVPANTPYPPPLFGNFFARVFLPGVSENNRLFWRVGGSHP